MSPTPLVRLRRRLRRSPLAPLLDHYGSLGLLRDRDLLLLSGANLLDALSVALVTPLLPLYADRLGAGPLLLGLVFAAETLSKALLSTPLGHLSDRFDRRRLVAGGLALSALSVVAFGLVASPLALVGLRALDGVGGAMRGPATNAYIGDAFDDSERGSAMGAHRTLGMLGVALGPALGGLLAAAYGLRVPFVVLGAGTLVGAVAVFAFLGAPGEAGDVEDSTADGADATREGADGDRANGASLRRTSLRTSTHRARAVATLPMVALGASVFVAQIGTGAYAPYLAVLLERNLGVGPGYTGTAYSLFGAALFVCMPVGGSLADGVGRKRVLLAGKLLWGGVAVGLALASSAATPFALLIVAGVASAFAGPALGALQYELAPDGHEGAALGAYSTLAAAGTAVGPLLAGAVVARADVTTLFLAIGALWALDTLTVAFGVRDPLREAD